MKKSLGLFPEEHARSLKEALLKEGIVSEIDALKYVKEDDLKYMPLFTGHIGENPLPNALEKAASLEVLVSEEDFNHSKKIQQDLNISSLDENIEMLRKGFNLSQDTLDKAIDFAKVFQLLGGGMRTTGRGMISRSATNVAFFHFIFNQKTRDYFKTGLGKKLLIGFILEVIILVVLLFIPSVNFLTGFIFLLLFWSSFMLMSFPYRERFSKRVVSIYMWVVNILAISTILLYFLTK